MYGIHCDHPPPLNPTYTSPYALLFLILHNPRIPCHEEITHKPPAWWSLTITHTHIKIEPKIRRPGHRGRPAQEAQEAADAGPLGAGRAGAQGRPPKGLAVRVVGGLPLLLRGPCAVRDRHALGPAPLRRGPRVPRQRAVADPRRAPRPWRAAGGGIDPHAGVGARRLCHQAGPYRGGCPHGYC